MVNLKMYLRWSWRDLRARWLQVIAIALIVALGTGVFAGLGGQERWRLDSLALSSERLNMYDLHVKLSAGGFVDADELAAALADMEGVDTLEARLVVPTLVDASHADETILVQGRLIGVDVMSGGPVINQIYVSDDAGRALLPEDATTNAAVIEYKFADYYGLQPGDPVRISGDVTLDVVGLGHQPEYFMVIPDGGSFMGESSFAIVFMPLDAVQAITGRAGLVNDIVLTVADGVDLEAVEGAIAARFAANFPAISIDYTRQVDDPVRVAVEADVEEDQVLWDMMALLFLLGAAMGAFNLAGRIVEAQRRQIGIGMALGVPRRWLALRPMLLSLQIALLGVVFGLLLGLVLSWMFAGFFQDVTPLPYWEITFYTLGFIRAALLGIALPFVATLIPVWRAVRVAPIDAIHSGTVVAKGGGLSWLLTYLPIPGKSFTQMPFRNILRSPWRTLLTIGGISVAILLMVAFVGFLDTFVATIDRAKEAQLYQSGERVHVTLDFFYASEHENVTALATATTHKGETLFEQVETALILPGSLMADDEPIDVMLNLYALDSAIWVPDLIDGSLESDEPGVVISEKMAEDLGVGVGDAVVLEYPVRGGVLAFRMETSDLPVIGIHNHPLRALTYMDRDFAALMNLDGVTNLLVANPAPGITADEVKLALIPLPGVASVEAVAEFTEAFEDGLDIFVTVLRAVQAIVLLLAFLIAFNSTSINVDERVREISTMFAFGLPVRTVTRMQMIENCVIGVSGTILGVIGGWFVLKEALAARVEEQFAEFKFVIALAPETLIISAVLGVLVVVLTPLLSIRRMQSLRLPETLRVME